MDETLETRLAAVERAVTDSDTSVDALEDAAAIDDRLTSLETAVAELEATVAELDAAVQAVRGYAGAIRAVNDEVEQRADLALAKAEALEESPRTRVPPESSSPSDSAFRPAPHTPSPPDRSSRDEHEPVSDGGTDPSPDESDADGGLLGRLRDAL